MAYEQSKQNSLRIIYLKGVFRPDAMGNIIRGCEDIGFKQATYVDGRRAIM